MTEKIRVLIVDDHPLFRNGLKSLLETEPVISVIAEAENGIEAIDLAIELEPDVILMDLKLPLKNGIEAIKEIKCKNSELKILVLTSFSEEENAIPAIIAGALGYIMKDSPPHEVIQAILKANQGSPILSANIATKMIQELQRKEASTACVEALTDRELEIVKLIAQGTTNEQIAQKLFISKRTVSTHINNINGKLNLKNRAQLVHYAIQNKLIDLDP